MSAAAVTSQMAQLGRATFGSRVIDPVVMCVCAEPIGAVGKFRNWMRTRRNDAESRKAMAAIVKQVPSFSEAAATSIAWNLYNKTFQAIQKGNQADLQRYVNDHYLPVLRDAIDTKLARTPAGSVPQMWAPVAQLTSPIVVQARLHYDVAPMMSGMAGPADGAQLIVRIETRQQLKEMAGTPGKVLRRPVKATSTAQWHAAFDSRGFVYYFNTATGAATWKRPEAFGRVHDLEIDLDDWGMKRTMSADGSLHLSQYCVIEARLTQNPQWKIACLE